MKKMTDCWMSLPPSGLFEVRQRNYKAAKKKAKSAPPAYQCIFGKMMTHDSKLSNLSTNLSFLSNFMSKHSDRQFFVACRILPTQGIYLHVIFLFCRVLPQGVDPAFDRVDSLIRSGSSSFRDTRFKYLAKLPAAPFVLNSTVAALGGYRPVILG